MIKKAGAEGVAHTLDDHFGPAGWPTIRLTAIAGPCVTMKGVSRVRVSGWGVQIGLGGRDVTVREADTHECFGSKRGWEEWK